MIQSFTESLIMEDSVAVIHFETTTTSIRVLRNGEIYNPVEIREEDNLCILFSQYQKIEFNLSLEQWIKDCD